MEVDGWADGVAQICIHKDSQFKVTRTHARLTDGLATLENVRRPFLALSPLFRQFRRLPSTVFSVEQRSGYVIMTSSFQEPRFTS